MDRLSQPGIDRIASQPALRKAIFLVISLAGLAGLVWFINNFGLSSWDFRNNLWAPAALIWRGESAYAIQQLYPDSNAIWLPQIIGLFVWIGLLPLQQATNLWLVINVGLTLVIIWLVLRRSGQYRPRPLVLGVGILMVFLFYPTLRHYVLGQVGVVLLSAMLAGFLAVEQRRYWLAGCLFALALTKPQLSFVLLTVFGLVLLQERAWLPIIKLASAALLTGSLLTIPLWVASGPAWVDDLIANFQSNPAWEQPNLFSLLTLRFGGAGLAAWAALYLLIIWIGWRMWNKTGGYPAMLWLLGLTTVISPYVWSWDFVLLLPLLIDTLARLRTWPGWLILTGTHAAGFVIATLVLAELPVDYMLWWIPYLSLAGIFLARRSLPAGEPQTQS